MKVRIALIIGILSSASACPDSHALTQAAAEGRSTARVVEVYRDDWGVPHIYADREDDGFYGLGYAQAEDRLNSILQKFLAVRGESASVFGPGAVQADLRARQWMHLDQAQTGPHRLEPQLRKDYQQFIAGIERYMRDHPKEIPPWAPRLDATLPIAVLSSLLWGVNEIGGVEDCARGGISVALEDRIDPSAGRLSVASNEWALMPWRTADNVVMHLADSHVPFAGELHVFEFRLHAGALELSGFSGDGLVLPQAAHNRNVAWAMTMGGPDVADCYAVEVDHNNPRRYLYDGKWHDMITRRVTVQVKGGVPVIKEFDYTRHNNVLSPVVARRGDTAYAVSSAYMDQAGLVDQQLYRMDLARDMAEFRQAMAILGMFSQNIMAGSSDGHTLYVRAGRVPIRPVGYDWRKPVPGNTSATAWRGIHPFSDLLVVQDPFAGYMTNNNVAPDMITEQPAVAAEKYAPEVFFDLPGFTNSRGRRVVHVLSSAFAFSTADAFDLVFDEKWEGTETWIEALRRALNEPPDRARLKSLDFRRFVDRILHFNGVARKESVDALDYLYWRTAVGNDGSDSIALSDAIDGHKELTALQRDALINGVEKAIVTLTAEHGTTEVRLGDVYRVGRGGQSWPIGGVKFRAGNEEITTLRAMATGAMLSGSPDAPDLRWVVAGQRQPCLTIFTNPIQSFTSAPFGQSDHPESAHYSDQARLLSDRRLKPTYFNKDELLKHVESKTVLRIN